MNSIGHYDEFYANNNILFDHSIYRPITDVHIYIYGLVLVETSHHVEDGPVTRSIIEILE